MARPQTLRAQLGLIFIFCLSLLGGVGLFSVMKLNDVNRDSATIRDYWLPATRTLGDLNNFTSDYRTAEASHLIENSQSPSNMAEAEIDRLNTHIEAAMRTYESMPHQPHEWTLYQRFKVDWQDYQQIAAQVFTLISHHQLDQADRLYRETSQIAYTKSSDALGDLTQATVNGASEASNRAAKNYAKANTLIVGALVASVMLILGLLIYIHRAISQPLSNLVNTMRELAAHNNRIVIQGENRPDEIGDMARAIRVFRENAIELALSQRGLEQQAQMLAEKLDEEQRLTNLQRNFVSMVSHEFRTPLTIIDGHAQRLIALREKIGPEDIQERADKIRRKVLRLTQVMENLLIASQMFDSDTSLHFHPAPISLNQLLLEVCHLHREISPDATIFQDFSLRDAMVLSDFNLLYQVFSNLLSNAIKYSTQKPTLTVSTRNDFAHKQVIVSITDQGIGIPGSDLPHIFDRYYRGGNVGGTNGTGIGLFLVKMVIDLHQGQIEVKSEVGSGTEFLISLPTL
jgi:two-component system, OmpR family, sensor kinase